MEESNPRRVANRSLVTASQLLRGWFQESSRRLSRADSSFVRTTPSARSTAHSCLSVSLISESKKDMDEERRNSKPAPTAGASYTVWNLQQRQRIRVQLSELVHTGSQGSSQVWRHVCESLIPSCVRQITRKRDSSQLSCWERFPRQFSQLEQKNRFWASPTQLRQYLNPTMRLVVFNLLSCPFFFQMPPA